MTSTFGGIAEGRVSMNVLNPETGRTEEHTLTMSEVVQVLVGSHNLPLDETCGLIEFDHKNTGLPIFSTCAPSISFRNVKEIQDYSTFQEKFSYAVVGSANYFGQEW